MPTLELQKQADDYLLGYQAARGPAHYLRSIGHDLYEAQEFIYSDISTPTMALATRQFGKTWCFAGMGYYTMKTIPRSLSAIVCPDQDKSKTMIERLTAIAEKDPKREPFLPDNTEEKGISNGSRIKGLPGTVAGVVSKSTKLLVFDEAALLPRTIYEAATPMQAHVDNPWTFAISSAWWKVGWFYDDWVKKESTWKKVIVRAAWDLTRDERSFVPAKPIEEYRAEMWEKYRAYAFYSEYPTKAFLEFELSRHPVSQIRQQYFCEFQDLRGAAFGEEWIAPAFGHADIKPLFGDDGAQEILSREVQELEV